MRRTGMVLEDLCDLARGIRPPLLAHQGSPSLEAQARNALQAHGVDRNACDRATTVRGSGLLIIAERLGALGRWIGGRGACGNVTALLGRDRWVAGGRGP